MTMTNILNSNATLNISAWAISDKNCYKVRGERGTEDHIFYYAHAIEKSYPLYPTLPNTIIKPPEDLTSILQGSIKSQINHIYDEPTLQTGFYTVAK